MIKQANTRWVSDSSSLKHLLSLISFLAYLMTLSIVFTSEIAANLYFRGWYGSEGIPLASVKGL